MRKKGQLVSDKAAEVFDLYINQKMKCGDIGKQLGFSKAAIHGFLRRSGVPTRSRSEAKLLCGYKGPRNPLWKGGVRPDGYAVRSERIAGKRRNILIHRDVAESCLSRPLTSDEVVHHCNEFRSDNRPINLWVFPTQADHARFHKDGTIAPGTLFPAAEYVMSFGQPWSTPWEKT